MMSDTANDNYFFVDGGVRTIPPLSKAELRATAHHEAGHAIIMMALGYPRPIEFVRIGIVIKSTPMVNLGAVKIAGAVPLTLTELTRDQLVNDVLGTLAGPLAEFHDQRHRRNPVCGESLDEYLNGGDGTSDCDEAMSACCEIAARDLGIQVADGEPWSDAVQTLAEKIAPELEARAQRLVEEHWHHIRKLAILLQQRGTVTGAEIWDLLTTPDQERAA
jgi:ATP-dependent Zn protease